MIECCNRKQRTSYYKVQTKNQREAEQKLEAELIENPKLPLNYILSNLYEEYIEVLECCSNCGKKIIKREQYYPHSGKTKELPELKNKTAERYEKKLYLKEQYYKETHVDKRLYLWYSEYGKKKKCYSNITGMKLGLIDPDEGLQKKSFAA